MFLRATSLSVMLLCNALMWTLFVKAMHRSRSTVEATIVNSASNFFFTVSGLKSSFCFY